MPTTALARKFRVDVTTDLTLASGWTQVNGIYSLKSGFNPNLVDTSAYDSNGWADYEITMNAWDLTVSFWRRTNSGVYDAGQEIIRACQGQFSTAARVGVRWYDKSGGPEAYSGVGIVEWDRANDGIKDADAATAKLTGSGAPNINIANPYAAAAVPVISAANPTGAATGALVSIYGQNFTGVTGAAGVKFGGTNATNYYVVSDQTIVATMPTGSAGSAVITVTNPAGTSANFAYTRG